LSDVTAVFDHYRMCGRAIWNTGFMPDPDLRNWDGQERFEELRRLLFEALVLVKIGRQCARHELLLAPLPYVSVVPNWSPSPVMIERPRAADPNHYWDDPLKWLHPGEASLHFIDYFDWDLLNYRDFQYYRCRISGFEEQPELIGREVLIETRYARVLLI
jgi:hypothetical protein